MSTPPTRRFALPDPDRAPMTVLPPEILSHILHLAQAGRPLAEQFVTRLTFESVCKSWYLCDNKWRVVSFDNAEQASGLLHTLDAAQAEQDAVARAGGEAGGAGGVSVAGAIRSVRVGLRGRTEYEEQWVVSDLLLKMTNVECVELLLDADDYECDVGWLAGDVIVYALGKLEKVKRFTITEKEGDFPMWTLPATIIAQLVKRWPKLESLSIKHCDTHIYTRPITGMLDSSPNFHSLELVQSGRSVAKQLALVAELPLSTRELKLNLGRLFFEPHKLAPLIENDHITEVAKGLTSVTLTDRPGERDPRGLMRNRGVLDRFIARLENVEELTISPVALSDFASLAKLKRLTALNVPVGRFDPSTPLKAAEVVALLNGSKSLKRVQITTKLNEGWSFEERMEVMAATWLRINLTWI